MYVVPYFFFFTGVCYLFCGLCVDVGIYCVLRVSFLSLFCRSFFWFQCDLGVFFTFILVHANLF